MQRTFPASFAAEIVTELPFGCPVIEIQRPEEAPRPDLLVEVTTDAGDCWIASIREPAKSIAAASTGVHPTPDPETMCVIARGDAFLLHVTALAEWEAVATGGPVTIVRPVVEEGVLLLGTPWRVTAIGGRGLMWQTRRLSIEGLRLDEVQDGRIAGVADPDDAEPRDFVIDLLTGEHDGGNPLA